MSDSTTGRSAGAAGDVQRQLLELIEQGQEAIVDAVRQWREAGERMMPDLPRPDASALMPDAEEMLAAQFDLAEQLLAAQRHFAEELLAAARPPAPPQG
jgi:hypothetical protein